MALSQYLKMTLLSIGMLEPETAVNNAILRLERATQRRLACDLTSADKTLTADEFTTNGYFDCTGHTVARNLIVPLTVDGVPNPVNRVFIVDNGGTATVTVKGSTGATVGVIAGGVSLLFCDGTDVIPLLAGGVGTTSLLDLSDTPSAYTSAGGYQLQINSGATAVEFVAKPWDSSIFFGGAPTNGQLLARLVCDRAYSLPASLTGSQGYCGTQATAAATVDLKKNGSAIGTVNFAASTSTATFTFASTVSFAAGDRLEFFGQATADATLADISITLLGTRT